MSPSDDKENFAYLSILDKNCEYMVVHVGYTLNNPDGGYDTGRLFDALTRVTEKWRLLAGRVEWDEKRKNYRIRIPLGELRKPAFKFTTAKFDKCLRAPSTAQSYVAPRLDIKYGWDSSAPVSLAKYASLDHPLLSVHVSVLNDAICIGVFLPHGIFDAVGTGLVMRAIEAEIHGRDWTPPPQPEYNAVERVFEELVHGKDLIDGPVPTQWVKTFDHFVLSTILGIFKFLTSILVEYLFRSSCTKVVFLDSNATQRLIREVKGQVKEQTNGEKWVSAGDIILAWFFKAALANETDLHAISLLSVFSIRPLLEAKDLIFKAYPHNAATCSGLTDISSAWLQSASIAELALKHRENLEDMRTLSYLQYVVRLTDSSESPRIMGTRWKEPTLLFSNQTIANWTAIDFGQETKVKGFCLWCPPIQPHNILTINALDGGYVVSGTLSKSRWDAVETEIERIKAGGGFVQ